MDQFLAVAVLLSAFSSLLLSLSRAAAVVAGWQGNQGFVAVSVANDDNGVKRKCWRQQIMTRIQATTRLPSPSPPMPDTRGPIITTRIATTTKMHAAAAAQIMGKTTGVLKTVGGTRRCTGITMQCHVTTNNWRAQQEVEPPAEKRCWS